MSYLARLKQLADAENFAHTPGQVLPKLTEGAFGGFVSTVTGGIEKITPANSPMFADDATTDADLRMAKVIDKLHADAGLRYAMEAHDDIEPEAVIMTLAIRDKGACELRIPREKYDPFLLLDLVEKYTTRGLLQ